MLYYTTVCISIVFTVTFAVGAPDDVLVGTRTMGDGMQPAVELHEDMASNKSLSAAISKLNDKLLALPVAAGHENSWPRPPEMWVAPNGRLIAILDRRQPEKDRTGLWILADWNTPNPPSNYANAKHWGRFLAPHHFLHREPDGWTLIDLLDTTRRWHVPEGIDHSSLTISASDNWAISFQDGRVYVGNLTDPKCFDEHSLQLPMTDRQTNRRLLWVEDDVLLYTAECNKHQDTLVAVLTNTGEVIAKANVCVGSMLLLKTDSVICYEQNGRSDLLLNLDRSNRRMDVKVLPLGIVPTRLSPSGRLVLGVRETPQLVPGVTETVCVPAPESGGLTVPRVPKKGHIFWLTFDNNGDGNK